MGSASQIVSVIFFGARASAAFESIFVVFEAEKGRERVDKILLVVALVSTGFQTE